MKVGDIVSMRFSCRYGVVESVSASHSHPWKREGEWCVVRLINPDTGLPMVCPDDRCGGRTISCPICRVARWADELTVWSERDVAFYQAEGMLSYGRGPKQQQSVGA